MKCSECIYYECALRSPMGGCPNGEKEETIPQINNTNSLGYDSYEKNNQPSRFSKAEEAAKQIYPNGIELFGKRDRYDNLVSPEETMVGILRNACCRGYKEATKDIISLIESRIVEILGDAQPAPVFWMELRELIDKIKEESK